MLPPRSRDVFTTLITGLLLIPRVLTATCQTATVGQPSSNCFDIASAAKITVDQLLQYNPGLDCSVLQLGQKLCITAGDPPSTAPPQNPDGTCVTYKVIEGDYCALIGTKSGITVAQIEQFNVNTYKWKGCSTLQIGQLICVSPGTPPDPPVNPDLQCGPESPGRGECPLKACCSAFGFCGSTAEFCEAAPNGDPCISNCGYAELPSCDGSQMKRKVGYYAGWAANRTCDPVGVDQLDLSDLTHVIYAFATIKDDMTIAFDDATDGDRLKQLVAKAAGKVKVSVAVGGWTFSEGATKDRFSVMIGSSENRATYISSVVDFISRYKLDGIDIDFEYPAAIERQAPPSDTPNLTQFFTELRAGLPSALISLATPAGYWFLKGFEMDKIAPKLDMINMMSYDYHGPWDTTVAGSNSTAEPQSSLLDMIDSAKLYVKAGIDLKKVNLGLAWYGRSYKLQDSDCTGYGCDMTGGGTKGKCTGESGVLAGFEVTDIMLDGELRPISHSQSQTRWFTYNGDLITFDDDDTRAAKAKWAGETCFGGSMIWSIDQQLPEAGAVPGIGIKTLKSMNPGLGAYWEEPWQSNDCESYGNREWRSRLWEIPRGYDWKKACEESPITIHGIVYDSPAACEDQGIVGGMIGKWYISDANDKYCRPNWGSLGDDGCTDFGTHRWWARLWNIPSGVDWAKMCKSTPVTIKGVEYKTTTDCDDEWFYGGEIGIWEVPDDSCKGHWGSFKDNGCSDQIGRREMSSKLFDIIGDWEDACRNRDAEVGDEYFSKPSDCQKHITGIWGIFNVQDVTCGVPPCPNHKTWDYVSGSCAACLGQSTLVHTNALPVTPRGLGNVTASYSPNFTSSFHSYEKRTKWCNPFSLPRPAPPAFNQIPDAWLGLGAAEGPTGRDIALSPVAQQEFQEAWNDSFNTPATARETGGWIYADQNDPSRIFIRRAPADRSTPMHQTRPAPNVAAGIDLWSPERASGRRPPAGFVLVATYHTHPIRAP